MLVYNKAKYFAFLLPVFFSCEKVSQFLASYFTESQNYVVKPRREFGILESVELGNTNSE